MENIMFVQVMQGIKHYSLYNRLVPQFLIKIKNQKFDPLSTIIVLKGFPPGFVEQIAFSFDLFGNVSAEFGKKSIFFKRSANLSDTENYDRKENPKFKMMIYEQFIVKKQISIEILDFKIIVVENKLYSDYFPKVEITGIDLNGVYLEEKMINNEPFVKYSEKIKALKEFDLFDVYEESNGVPNLDDEDYDGIYFKANDYRDYLKSNNKITIRDIDEWYKFRLDIFIGGFNKFNDNDVLALCINAELLQNQNFRQEMAALQVLAEANDLELYVFINENKVEKIMVSPPKPFPTHPEHILAIKLGDGSSEINMENGCKWHFGLQGDTDEITGTNDPLIEHFKAGGNNPYYSIVREAIQNSLDAAISGKKVCVKFSFEELNKEDFPELCSLGGHRPNCVSQFDFDSQTKLKCLKISDHNTTGMSYTEGASNCPFVSFTRGQGISSKGDSGTGGSFGFGKGAYYGQSGMRSIIVSTRFKSNNDLNVAFQAVARLEAHEHNNAHWRSLALYSKSTKPITKIEEIPKIFQRDEIGTDIWTLGISDSEEDISDNCKHMKRSVIDHFWLAIRDEKLIVRVDDCEISKNNLEEVIAELYSDSDIENPSCFVNAMNEVPDSIKVDVNNITINSQFIAKLYVQLAAGKKNVQFFRKQNMKIYEERISIPYEVCAVFVCDDDYSNNLLRFLENPSHDTWNANLLKGKTLPSNYSYFTPVLAKKLLKEIKDKVKFEILKKFPEESKESYPVGEGYFGDDEEIIVGLNNSKRRIPPSYVFKQGTVKPDEDGPESGGTGETQKKHPEDGKVGPGMNPNEHISVRSDPEGKNAIVRKQLPFRVFAMPDENGTLYHYITIHSNDNYYNCSADIKIGSVGAGNAVTTSVAEITSAEIKGEDGNFVALKVTKENLIDVISDFRLAEGPNIIRVEFTDNLKHSIKIQIKF